MKKKNIKTISTKNTKIAEFEITPNSFKKTFDRDEKLVEIAEDGKDRSLDVQKIFDDLAAGKLSIKDAVVGFDYSSGVPIYDSEDISLILALKQYSAEAIWSFIVEYSKLHDTDNSFPIVMLQKNRAKILEM